MLTSSASASLLLSSASRYVAWIAAWMASASSRLASWHELMMAAWTGAEHSSSSSSSFWFVCFDVLSSAPFDCLGFFFAHRSLRSFVGGLPLYFWELPGAFGGNFRGDLGGYFGFTLKAKIQNMPFSSIFYCICYQFNSQFTQKITNYRRFPSQWLILSTKMI